MSRPILALVAIFTLATGVAVYLLLPSSSTRTGSVLQKTRESRAGQVTSAESESHGSEELNARVAALAAEVALLRQKVVAQAQPTAEVAATASAQPLPLRRDPEALAKYREEQHERMADVEGGFRAERRDANWAATTEATIRSVLGKDAAVRDTVKTIDCLAKTCRVELNANNAAEIAKRLPRLLPEFLDAFTGTNMDYVDNLDGTQSAILYMSRNNSAAAPNLHARAL